MSSPKWTPEEIGLAKRLLAVERRYGHNELPWSEQGDAEQDRLMRLARYVLRREKSGDAYQRGQKDGDLRGHHGWRLRDVRVLAEPIPIKGRLGLWKVPEEIAALIEEAPAR